MIRAYIIPDDQAFTIIKFDATDNEGHTLSSEVTDHPVEKGSNVADHIRQQPTALTIEMIVSNTPIDDLDGLGSVSTLQLDVPVFSPPFDATPGAVFRLAGQAATAIKDGITGGPPPIKVNVLTFGAPFDRIADTYAALMALWENSVTMSVVTSIYQYDTMAITKISLPRKEFGSTNISLDFKQIRTVTTATVAAPKPLEKRGATIAAKGSQSNKPVNGQDAANGASVAIKALVAVGNLTGLAL